MLGNQITWAMANISLRCSNKGKGHHVPLLVGEKAVIKRKREEMNEAIDA